MNFLSDGLRKYPKDMEEWREQRLSYYLLAKSALGFLDRVIGPPDPHMDKYLRGGQTALNYYREVLGMSRKDWNAMWRNDIPLERHYFLNLLEFLDYPDSIADRYFP